MIDNDIMWVKLVYNDESESIFRGTRSKPIIEDILGQEEPRDIFNGNVLSDLYVFDVSSRCFVDMSNVLQLLTYKTKPQFSREVDKFASTFIR